MRFSNYANEIEKDLSKAVPQASKLVVRTIRSDMKVCITASYRAFRW